jgi:hypothetical protein
VYSGGTGTAGFFASGLAAVCPEMAATDIQCVNVVLVRGVLPTFTTALPGMPLLLPHAESAITANMTAPSAEVSRGILVTTRAL